MPNHFRERESISRILRSRPFRAYHSRLTHVFLLSANYKNIYDGIDRQNHRASAKEPPFADIFRRAWQAKILTTCVLPTQLQWHSQPNAHFLAALQPATVQRLRQRIAQRVKIHRLFKIRRRSQIAAEILRFCPTLATDHKPRNQLRGAE